VTESDIPLLEDLLRVHVCHQLVLEEKQLWHGQMTISNIPGPISSFCTMSFRVRVSGRCLGQEIFVRFVIHCANMFKVVNITVSSTCHVSVG